MIRASSRSQIFHWLTSHLSLYQIAQLLCRSPHLIDQLAGIMKDDGARQQGELDKYLDRNEVDTVLSKAAETFRRHIHDRSQAELAAKLFMLAGKYSSLISLLNELITPADKDDDDKRYVCGTNAVF
jgi:hypothetical protein